MKMKRILAVSAALAVCAGLSMPAYAASGKMKLYTQPISELGINGGDGLWNRGDLYGIGTSDGIEKLISITGIDAKNGAPRESFLTAMLLLTVKLTGTTWACITMPMSYSIGQTMAVKRQYIPLISTKRTK